MLIKENQAKQTLVDLSTLATELHLRGFDQEKVDSALGCLVHVHAVQDAASPEVGGVLAEDILNTYPLEVVQAASQLFLETSKFQGREVFRVKWGCEDAAEKMEDELWRNATERWEEYVAQVNRRYLGFVMPETDEPGRVIADWKLSKELKWFSVELPRHGWNVLRLVDDIAEVAIRLDLGFEFRSFGNEGLRSKRVLLHQRAYEELKKRRENPPAELRKLIRLWKFFSEYDVRSTDFVALMNESGLTLNDVLEQIGKFFASDLTSQYREGQYPPYFINDKKKKEYETAVRDLLRPMDEWLAGGPLVRVAQRAEVVERTEAPAQV